MLSHVYLCDPRTNARYMQRDILENDPFQKHDHMPLQLAGVAIAVHQIHSKKSGKKAA